MKHDFHMNKVYLTLACALAWGGALAQSKSPFELLTPEDVQRVSKYYEVQFGSERRDEMLQHVATNRRLLDLVSNCENSKHEDLIKGWRKKAGLLFLAFAGEDYSAAQVCEDEWRGSARPTEPVPEHDKELIIAASIRGGPSTGSMHARWMINGVEVLKDEVKGGAQLARCAQFSVHDMEVYSGWISRVKNQKQGSFYPEIASEFPNYFDHEHCLKLAMDKARENKNHVDYLALGYVGMVRYRYRQTDYFYNRAEYTGVDPSRVREYEAEFGDKSSSWLPWSPSNRTVAQEKAAKIQLHWKQLIREPIAKSDDPMYWVTHRAHNGDSVGMYDVGVCYLGGTSGFPKNPEAARRWFGFSSARGFVPGSYNYANCLMQGVGGPADPKEAARLFRLCALRADPLSQHNLGSAYANGRGVDRDLVEAAAWWLVCEAKVPEAKSNLAKLSEVAGPKIMSKAKARSEILRGEIDSFLNERKNDLIW